MDWILRYIKTYLYPLPLLDVASFVICIVNVSLASRYFTHYMRTKDLYSVSSKKQSAGKQNGLS